MNKAEIMRHIAEDGYRVHEEQEAPGSPSVNDTEKALWTGYGRRTATHGLAGGCDETPANSTGIGGDCSNCGIEDVRLYPYTTKNEMQTVDVCSDCLETLNPLPLDSAFPENQHSTYAEDESKPV